MIDGAEKPLPSDSGLRWRHRDHDKEDTRMETRTREDRLMEVIELLARGAWEEAHAIVQPDKSAEAAWLHGVVHTIEGDLENAQHWYRKAKRAFPDPVSVEAELAAARQVLGQTR
jgi:hypothetical protein